MGSAALCPQCAAAVERQPRALALGRCLRLCGCWASCASVFFLVLAKKILHCRSVGPAAGVRSSALAEAGAACGCCRCACFARRKVLEKD